MKKLKVVTVVGTRPETIRLSRVINTLNTHPAINHILVHTGQNYDYELNEIFFEELEIEKPQYVLESKSDSEIGTISTILAQIDTLLDKEKPDAFLVLGDTNSALTAFVAKKKKIPIFHMEAGNRCFDERVPEEINRKIIDHIADINLPYSNIARSYLIKENIPQDRIIKTGSPLFEVLNYYKEKIDSSRILETLQIEEKSFFLVSIHRAENVDNPLNLKKLVETLQKVATTYQLPVIVSTHPRTRKKIDESKFNFHNSIHFLKPLGFFDYNFLQKNALVVLSDSGSISEEAAMVGFNAINLRETHERPEAMEEASVIMSGLHHNSVIRAIEACKNNITFRKVEAYQTPNVSEKIVRILLSYTEYVNQNVWKKKND